MRYFSPSPILRPYVRHYALSESALASEYPVYPSTGIVMGFQYGGRIDLVCGGRADSLESAGITGLQTGVRRFRGVEDTSTLLVYFTPTGAFAIFGPTVADMADGSYGLRSVQARAGWDELPERLAGATDDAARIAVVEKLLLRMLWRYEADARIARAAKSMIDSAGAARVGDLARSFGMSERSFGRSFGMTVGTSPKRFLDIARFVKTLEDLRAGKSGVRTGAAAGYHDQAHFIRDFTRHAGVTPGRFSAEAEIGGFLQSFPEWADILEEL